MIFCFINCQTREIVNKKESSEYKNALGKLKKLKLKEEKIYNLIGHDYAKINDMLYPEFDR